MKRPRYTEEFKREAVKQVLERGYKQKDVAENLGISAPSLLKWIKDFRGDNSSGAKNQEDHKTEIAKLKADLRRVTEERDILKKAAVFFANNPE